MSLNGLDEAKVAEAYAAAAAEPGGWFLLKYASRDEVDLLNSGTGGEAEVRNAVAEYEELSPLYGFLRYRRRNVIIKYLPDGCSRLIQARVAVHFNAVCERFSPFDTQFEITVADDVRDSKLSAACSLHAASGSNSSSNSPRRKHLMEIAEEDEEEQQPTKRQSLIKDSSSNEVIDHEGSKAATSPMGPVKLDSDLATLPENTKFSAASTSEVPNFVGADESTTTGDDRRMSSQSGRDIHTSYSSFPTYSKPKVKIGPRPSLDTNFRPQTAGNFRPVSTIPSGFKLFGKGSTKKSTESSSGKGSIGSVGSPDSEVSDSTFGAAISSLQEPADKESLSVPRPATSSGVSIKSTTTTNSKLAMTPEKARLKKAMQLREKKRKIAAKNPPVSLVTPTDLPAEDAIAIEEQLDPHVKLRTPVVQTDSGIAMDSLTKDDQASEVTVSDSRPTSPIVASSEAAQSTKASSISDSTEQTVHGDDAKEDEASRAQYADGATRENLDSSEVTESASREELVPSGAFGMQTPEVDVPTRSVPPSTIKDTIDTTEASEGTTAATELPIADVPRSMPHQPSSTPVDPTEHRTLTATDDSIRIPSHANPSKTSEEKENEKAQIPHTPADVEAAFEDIDSKVVSSSSPPATVHGVVITSASLDEMDNEAPPEQLEDGNAAEAGKAVEVRNSDTGTLPAQLAAEPMARRKMPKMDPIRVDLANHDRATSQSEVHFSDSESLLEELQSATVEEARPMIVSKTPVTPVFPGKPAIIASPGDQNSSIATKPVMVRTVSNPVRGNLARLPSDVSQSSARSISQGGAAYLHKITQQRTGDNGLGKKSNVGSSISQRIKALELLSVNQPETASQPGSRPSSTFFSVKKDRVPSRSPSVVDRTNSLSRDIRPTTAQSRGDSPEFSTARLNRERSGSISSRLSMFEPADSPGYQPRGRPETISVTARIMRGSPSTSRNAADRSPLELKQSQISIDHQCAEKTEVHMPEQLPSQERQTGHSREPSKDSVNRRSSFTIVKDFIKEGRMAITSPSTDNLAAPGSASGSRSPPPTHQNSSFSRRLSIGSRRSLSRDRGSISPSIVTEGSGSGDDTKSTSDKKKSRTSRLMRRLSTLSGSNRNKTSNPVVGTPTVTEEESPEPKAPAPQEGTGVAVDLGDVNVQFPDTLLWKRRNMYLDTQGFLILSAAAQQPAAKVAGVKRYHLSEFKHPYCPDVEVQELPNSVVLDFLEGSAIQVACVDRPGQTRVLTALQEAYSVHGAKAVH